jgi:hypothetical protein
MLTSAGGIIMTGEKLEEKPVHVPLCQKALIWIKIEPMHPRTEVDFL